jgi:ABC-type bacteriocin/lantibiotic exporter with double-glycine peptidase domain
MGKSGSGKTTLIDLILGLLEPAEGKITLDSLELGKDCTLTNWRSQIGYLPQEIFLTDSTLRNNIALGINDDDIDDGLIFKAIEQASLTETVELLPKGIYTNIGERGVRLSGGQSQRVALARAFYHGRGVLVMDESTSALDSSTEKDIIQEIVNLKGQVTMIVIAHRLSTLKHCDRIYELQDGRILKTGTYDAVVKGE